MQYDIIIVGGGVVGLTAALQLAQKNESLKIAVLENKATTAVWKKEKYDHRVSAISLATKNILQKLSVWNSIQDKRVSPYRHMHVWDAQGAGEIHFDSRDVGESVLGYIIEDSAIRSSLLTKLSDHSHIDYISPIQLKTLQQTPGHIELLTEDQKSFSAKLLIAADGANSWVREHAGITLKTRDYEHIAIVTTVKTEKPHEQTAWQRFLPTGPLAFLPLEDSYRCSIVWSATPEYAQQLLALDDKTFCAEITAALAEKLGKIISVDPQHHFHLHMRHAKNYVLPRIALIGDAAHTIHPLAGQGVNLGMLDAICLSEIVTQARKKSRDFASLSTLRKYERWRKSDNVVMLAVVEGLKTLFASDKKIVQSLRNAGLNLTHRTPLIKRFIADYALGKRKDMPGTVFS